MAVYSYAPMSLASPTGRAVPSMSVADELAVSALSMQGLPVASRKFHGASTKVGGSETQPSPAVTPAKLMPLSTTLEYVTCVSTEAPSSARLSMPRMPLLLTIEPVTFTTVRVVPWA
jgi:hypothetical protein